MAGEHRDRTRFLADLTVDPPASTSDLAGPPHLDDDYLILSTIHSAKGGEWQVVHVIHAADGNIPSDMALGEPGGLDEERRLLYVALTRARDSLTVTWPQRFYHRRHGRDDVHSWAQPSRFLVGVDDVFDTTIVARPEAEMHFTPIDGPAQVTGALADLWSCVSQTEAVTGAEQERLVRLDGILNFRDLGGYRDCGGRAARRGDRSTDRTRCRS